MKRLQLLVITVALLVAACGGRAAAAPTAQPPAVSVTPEPIVDPPFEASGVISFGTGVNDDTLAVTGAKSSFKASVKKFAFSASFSEPAGALELTLIIAKVGASGSESVRWTETLPMSSPNHDIIANNVDIAVLVDNKPGTYVMRILREATVLAEGTFTLVK